MLPKYSTNEHFGRFNVIDELQQRNLLVVEGRKRTSARQHRVSVEAYVELLHARNGFSRQRMAAETAHEFDAAVRDLVSPYAHQKMLLLDMATTITWGHPPVRASDHRGA
ncbi:MAG: hypothetical protein OXH07_03190 [Chloroflexi bacterium]|nr:hypothetical protein [Chloroflexota bacterium]